MSDHLRDLYQQIILDHNRSPRNRGRLEDANRHAEGYNPLCGDKMSLELKVDDGVITDVRFEGSGCAGVLNLDASAKPRRAGNVSSCGPSR